MPFQDLQEALNLIDSGRADEALPLLTTWAQQMPAYAAVHAMLARAYEATGQWDKAQASWKQTHFLMPNSPAADDGLRRIESASNRTEDRDEDRLIMDLDLETELEATLEALFNPFTLPQPREIRFNEESDSEEEHRAQRQAEAARAAEAIHEENALDVVLDEISEALGALTLPPTTQVDPTEDTVELSEHELDVMLRAAPEEEASDTDTLDAADSADEPLTETATENHTETPAAEEHTSTSQELEKLLKEEQQALKALEELAPEANGEDSLELEGWTEFDAEPEPSPTSDELDEEVDDLDRLINELETARIIPQPEFDENEPLLDLEDDIEDVVSETLARIYASQNKYSEAARIYEELARQEPDEADRFNKLAQEMRVRAGEASE